MECAGRVLLFAWLSTRMQPGSKLMQGSVAHTASLAAVRVTTCQLAVDRKCPESHEEPVSAVTLKL